MSEEGARLQIVFEELRRVVTVLGVSDLLQAASLFDYAREQDESVLKRAIRMLWCRFPWEEREFDRLWAIYIGRKTQILSQDRQLAQNEIVDKATDSPLIDPPFERLEGGPVTASQPQELTAAAIPIKAPPRLALCFHATELSAPWPIHRRSMAYGWQRLRLQRLDGPDKILDIEATVKELARRGHLSKPIYVPEMRNRLCLVLLVDRRGSMSPFHPFTRDLVETSRQAQREGTLRRVETYYFHNVITDHLYSDSRLMKLITAPNSESLLASPEQVLSHCDGETAFLIVSDCGAARGKSEGQLQRIVETEDMLHRLSQITRRIAWLNPMPAHRWRFTPAGAVASITPMFESNSTGFMAAIKRLQSGI